MEQVINWGLTYEATEFDMQLVVGLIVFLILGWLIVKVVGRRKHLTLDGDIKKYLGNEVENSEVFDINVEKSKKLRSVGKQQKITLLKIKDIKSTYTLVQFDKFLKLRREKLNVALFRSSPEDKTVVRNELANIKKKLSNLDNCYNKRIFALYEHIELLKKYKRVLPDQMVKEAILKLQSGDDSFCDFLLKQIQKKSETTIKQAAEAAFLRGKLAKERVEFNQCYRHFERAVQFQPENTHYLIALGTIADQMSHYDNAIQHFEAVLVELEKNSDSQTIAAAIVRNLLANAWTDKGNYDKAISYYCEALKVYINTFRESQPDAALIWNNLGVAWAKKGDVNMALGYFEKAAEIWKKQFGDKHPSAKQSLKNLETARDMAKGDLSELIPQYSLSS